MPIGPAIWPHIPIAILTSLVDTLGAHLAGQPAVRLLLPPRQPLSPSFDPFSPCILTPRVLHFQLIRRQLAARL